MIRQNLFIALASVGVMASFALFGVTDFHHDGPECDPWMEKLFKQVGGTDNASFCLGLGDLANKGERASLESIKRLSGHGGMPFYASPGNHDLDE